MKPLFRFFLKATGYPAPRGETASQRAVHDRRREGRLRYHLGKIPNALKLYIQKSTSRRPLIIPFIFEI